jgi:fucose 4-O-acetylase-like acetyltransferase
MDLESAVPDAVLGIILLLVFTSLPQPLLPAKAMVLKERLRSFDFLKGVCIVFIIMMHAKDIASIPPLLEALLWLAVPCFIFASGYLLSRRNPEGAGKGYFQKIWWRIGLLYVVFTLAWMLLTHVALDQLPAYLLLGRANGGTLYFIPVLLSLYIIYPALIKARNALGWDVFLLLCLCFSALSEYTDLQYAAVSWDANPLSLAFFGRLLFVFAAGMYLSRVNMERLMGWAAAVIAFCVSIAAIVLVGQQGFHFFSYFFGPVAFSCLLLAVHRGIADVVRIITWVFEQLGKNSLIIYMTHSTLLYMVLKPNFTAYQGAEAFFILVLLTTALSYAFSLIFMKAYRVVLQALGVSEVKSA